MTTTPPPSFTNASASLFPRLHSGTQTTLPRTRQRHATLAVYNHAPIYCHESKFGDGWNIVPVTVVSVLDSGFAKVPYSKNMSKAKQVVTKPLGEVSGDDLRLFSFEKASMAKGERLDDVFVEITPGCTFKLFMDQSKFRQMVNTTDKTQHLLPTDGDDEIPAFSLLEVALTAKNGENALQKFSMVNIQTVRPMAGHSLHSVVSSLSRLPNSLTAALTHASNSVAQFPHFQRDLEREMVGFFVPECATNACVELVDVQDQPFIRVSGWNAGSESDTADAAVDMPLAPTLRLLNASDQDAALNLLAIAFAMRAVSLVVAHDSYFERSGGAPLRAVPLVRPERLLAIVRAPVPHPDSEVIYYSPNCTYDDGEGVQELEIQIRNELQKREAPASLPSPDFPAGSAWCGGRQWVRVCRELTCERDARRGSFRCAVYS